MHLPGDGEGGGQEGLYVGAPIRKELLAGDRERGLKLFGFTSNRPVLLVVGGSLGAQAINRAVRGALDDLTRCFQVLHICGKGNIDANYEGRRGYVQMQYLDEEMADAYACADVIITRAGSNTICEILALRKPSLLIPYPNTASRGDQEINAASFLRRGFSRVLEQSDLTPGHAGGACRGSVPRPRRADRQHEPRAGFPVDRSNSGTDSQIRQGG